MGKYENAKYSLFNDNSLAESQSEIVNENITTWLLCIHDNDAVFSICWNDQFLLDKCPFCVWDIVDVA